MIRFICATLSDNNYRIGTFHTVQLEYLLRVCLYPVQLTTIGDDIYFPVGPLYHHIFFIVISASFKFSKRQIIVVRPFFKSESSIFCGESSGNWTNTCFIQINGDTFEMNFCSYQPRIVVSRVKKVFTLGILYSYLKCDRNPVNDFCALTKADNRCHNS